jgi:hypothetical protein
MLQTIEIPSDRRVHIDLDLTLPEVLPPHGVRFEIFVMPEKITVSGNGAEKPQNDFDEFFGVFKGKHIWEGDSVEIIRKMRNEW